MRVAVGIHGADIERAIETYNLMSERYFTHASPTLFNAGTPNPQMSSCFLVCMKDDSIEGIYSTLKDCAMISKTAGGIGINIHNIRATGYVVWLPWFCFIVLNTSIARTSRAPMATPTVLSLCFVCTTLPLGMSIKVATSVLVPSQSTSSHGMQMSSSSLTCARTTARRRSALVTCSTLFGFLISCELIVLLLAYFVVTISLA